MHDPLISLPQLRRLPRRANGGICKFSLILSDLLALLVAATFANALHWFYLGAEEEPFTVLWTNESSITRLQILGLMTTSLIVWCWLLGHYTRRRPFWDEFAEILRVVCLLAALDATLLYLTKSQFSRFWFLGLWLGAMALIPVLRMVTKELLLQSNLWQRPVIVVGIGQNALEAAAALQSESTMGYKVVAFAEPTVADRGQQRTLEFGGRRLPIICFDPDAPSNLSRPGAPMLVVAYDQLDDIAHQARLIARLHRSCDDLHVVPPLRGLPLFGTKVNYIFRHEVFFLSLSNNLARRGPRLLKRLFDLGVSALLLLTCLPIFAYLALRIRMDGGPAFFRHQRIGHRGKPLRCIKFRTMVPNAQSVLGCVLANDPAAREEWDHDFKLKKDPRITPMGQTLRKYSIDELPQLWNVFKGEMSLVGPRPIVASEIERYGDDREYYLETKPGMTGLWQISGRNDTGYGERVHLDSWYAKNWSLWMDLVILIKTPRVVLKRDGAY